MLCQFRVRACADWTRATDRVRRRLLERAIDAGAQDLPHPRDAHHTITASQGGRECKQVALVELHPCPCRSVNSEASNAVARLPVPTTHAFPAPACARCFATNAFISGCCIPVAITG